ncbi:hypothetical protein B0H16DRAFT_1479259 [Mycena metata]|uniref:Ribonuclease H1 N-terminal domain-containing protein n=1 Tax=Mycena metata TaxID=1033252 RepID=A0AAD7H559_9AGAR|nr:hypothetical protein B0H16DRAFT_1479259 [Mycena metata]
MSSQLPLYDLDEIIATLTLDDLLVLRSHRAARSTRASPGGPIIPTAPPPSPPILCPTSSPPPQPATRQHIPRSLSVRSAKPRAYTVFRGRSIGVFDHWPQAERAVSGIRFGVHQGYSTRERADAAFALAQANGWTYRGDAWMATAVASSEAPLPVTDEAGRCTSESLFLRGPADPWYIVYAGVNPGIFPTFVECALNVLGICGSVHEKAPTFAVARTRFEGARERGEVRVCRACVDVGS